MSSKEEDRKRVNCWLGAAVRAKRIEANVSQSELADEIGADQAYVSRMESGIKPISVSMLLEICKVINTSAAELLQQVERHV